MKAIGLVVGALATAQSWGLTCQSKMQGDASTMTSRFPHVHPDIVAILECPPSKTGGSKESDRSPLLVDPETLEILWKPCPSPDADDDDTATPVSTRLLVDLAYASDDALYQQQTRYILESESFQTLVAMGNANDSQIVAATLLALNRLESAIRRATGYTAGRAPLLKTMVNQLKNSSLCSILMTLLLPTGLNLRNLLWHGFVASHLSRWWLSLVLILTYNLEETKQTHEQVDMEDSHVKKSLKDMMRQPSVQALLTEHERSSDDDHSITLTVLQQWLPASHHDLLELALTWRNTKPACSIALLSIILEHGLRLEWCRINEGQKDNAIARKGVYYITLDGHGQKHQHDLILYPYIGGGNNQENQLIFSLGGATVALLTDLYASSCGGPNLRAALAHGLWDAQLDNELMASNEEGTFGECHDVLVKMANLVLIAMKGAASPPSPPLCRYHPLFSYRAVTLRNLDNVLQQLERLDSLRVSDLLNTTKMMSNDYISTLDEASFEQVADRVFQELNIATGDWNAEHVFEEHGINAVLADVGASRSLLEDLVVAISSFASILEQAISELHSEDAILDRRQVKRLQRTCSVADIAVKVYQFAALIAVLSLEEALCRRNVKRLPADILLKAVQRSRMCVSTFSNFLLTNTDRSLKAAIDYTKGKAIKTVLEHIQS